MFKKSFVLALSILALGAASRRADAACISATGTKNQIGNKTIFDVGGDTFGASMKVKGGLWNSADAKAEAAEVVAMAKALGVTIPMPSVPSDFVQVMGRASAHLSFFGEGLTLLELGAKSVRSSGAFSRKYTVEVAGIDLHSGANDLTEATKTIPYSMPFYTIGTRYSGVYAEGTILGEIGVTARAHAAADSLLIDGRAWAALVLEGSAGVSIGVAGVGLFADVDLLEVGLNYKDSIGLKSGAAYDFLNTYDARTMDGKVALKANALGASATVWDGSWTGTAIATKTLYDVNGCVQ